MHRISYFDGLFSLRILEVIKAHVQMIWRLLISAVHLIVMSMQYFLRALTLLLFLSMNCAICNGASHEIMENEDVPLVTIDDLNHSLKKIEENLLRPATTTCVRPFEEFAGMCLFYNDKELTWF